MDESLPRLWVTKQINYIKDVKRRIALEYSGYDKGLADLSICGVSILPPQSTFHNGAPHICERRIVMKDNGVATDFSAQTLPKCGKICFDRGGLHLRVAFRQYGHAGLELEP